MKRAFITGITGQDGSYLAELLLEKGYEVHGLIRRSVTIRLDYVPDGVILHEGDLLDSFGLNRIIDEIQPHEVYNLAAQSFVGSSWLQKEYTFQVNAIGCLNLLEAVQVNCPSVRFYQASSSEMFGNNGTTYQDEQSRFKPCSPYGIAKLAAHHFTINYRESYGLFTCSGILFNHESPRRGKEFVTQKIASFAKNPQGKLHLGNIDARRDWGFAGDYVKAMWMMLQQNDPTDYIIGTGKTYSVWDFVLLAGVQDYVEIDERYKRPKDLEYLCANPVNAKINLGWEPTVTFRQLVDMMIKS